MNKIYLFLGILISNISYGQIPSGYYNTASGTGYILKTQLYNKIKDHTNKGYDGLWTTYGTSDRDKFYENDNTILDIYSENPSNTDPYNYAYITKQCGTYISEGNCYNREHIVPQSVFNSVNPMVADAHFIPPTDGKVNSQRANYPHGTVATVSWTSYNGSKLGESAVSGYTGTVFEPIDEFKGDIARMYFYFATRYENTVANYSYPMFDGSSNKVFTTAFINMLLTWHNQDPVSTYEISRNNAIYLRQGNRNPFIDNPSYVNAIWGAAPGNSTGGTSSSITELYFSEYLEGTSNNKALEITNATGSSKNLTYYVVKKQTNGAGSWSTGISLSGTLANNCKFVIVNSNISSACYNKNTANISTTVSELTFNGNDAIGLFKNNILIDIIGNFNGGSSNFAADVTLKRKSTATKPKASYNSTDWDTYSVNTCNGLGNKNGIVSSKEENEFKVFPNPTNGAFTIQGINKFKIEIYTIVGQKIMEKEIITSEIISSLEKGTYLIKISTEENSVSKIVIIN
jgi:endonuclease I